MTAPRQPNPSDLLALAKVLADFDVEYVVIGGAAQRSTRPPNPHDVLRSSTRRWGLDVLHPTPFCMRLRWVSFAGSGGAIV